MAGSVSPEFGTIIKVIVALMVFLGMEYLAVVVKLLLYDNHTLTWRIIFGLITPVLILAGLIISNALDDKTINVILFFLLAGMNLIYLLSPVNDRLTGVIYSGSNNIVTSVIFGLLSIATSVFILSVFITAFYFILKK
jgi:hypothetical protein